MTSIEMLFGQADSHSPWLVQEPKYCSMVSTIASVRLKRSAWPWGSRLRCEILAPVKRLAAPFGHAATHAPQPMHSAESIAASDTDIPTEGLTWPELVDDLFSKVVEPTLVQPTFVIDFPKEISPLAKDHRSEPGLVERFEAFAGGMEIANAFSELNDPDEQRSRFEAQQRFAAEGHDEAMPLDEAYLQALEQGLPPTGGIGIGIDRLVMLLTGKRTIREVVLFPAMRD